jgi:hypothetical protein
LLLLHGHGVVVAVDVLRDLFDSGADGRMDCFLRWWWSRRAREREQKLNPSWMCNSNGGSGGSGFGIGLHVLGKEQQEPACMFS